MAAMAVGGTLSYLLQGRVLRRNLVIAAVVGTLLTLANQWDVLLREPFGARLAVTVFFNYLIPFLVSSVASAINRGGRGSEE